MTLTFPVYRAAQAEVLLWILLELGSDWTASGTDYWDFSLRRLTADQTFGSTVASYSLSTRSLTAFVPVTVYKEPTGFALEADDRLVLYAVSTGSPAVPKCPRFHVLKQSR